MRSNSKYVSHSLESSFDFQWQFGSRDYLLPIKYPISSNSGTYLNYFPPANFQIINFNEFSLTLRRKIKNTPITRRVTSCFKTNSGRKQRRTKHSYARKKRKVTKCENNAENEF